VNDERLCILVLGAHPDAPFRRKEWVDIAEEE
jgi:hypothetical protein